jgi:cellulose synthase (UDP-forming)
VTNVTNGTPAAEDHTAVDAGEQRIITNSIGNSGMTLSRRAIDDLLGEQIDRAGRSPAQGSRSLWQRALNRPAERAVRVAVEPLAQVAPEPPRPGRALSRPGGADIAIAPAADGTSVVMLQPSSLAAPLAGSPAPDDTTPLVKVRPVADAPARGKAPSYATAPLQAVPSGAVPSGPVLPIPPTDEEKYRYVRRNAWVLTVLGAASFPLMVFGQIRMMLEYHWFLVYSPIVILSLAFLLLPVVTDAPSRGFNFDEHRRLVDSWRPTRYPSVDVFLPVCGEPLEVLRNTWKYVTLMNHHYQGAVTCYVLDDSHSHEVKAMARQFGFVYATRPNRGWFKKSGNLWFGYQVSYSEFIMLMDADFCPRHDFLDEVMPYMDAYPDIGIVQTPQFFRVTDDQNWLERGAGAVQELFYRSIQSARARKGGAICCGSCALYRRAALQDNVGMTLAEVGEDMLTGFDLKKYGWRLHYIPVALSTGNCPDNVLAFMNQQYRWCAASVGLLLGKRFWGAKLPLYSRMCYVSGLVYYVYTALFTFVLPALSIGLLAFAPNVLVFSNMLFLVPVLLYQAVIFPAWHRSPFRLEAWSVRLITSWSHFFAYWDALRGRDIGWKPSGGRKQDGARRFWTCFTVWSVGTAAVWTGLGFFRMVTLDPANYIVMFSLGFLELMVAIRVLIQPPVDAHA